MTLGSRVNGPGCRSVVHLQGCTLGCPGCFNPQTHAPAGGAVREVRALADSLMADTPDGVTISGGEPFQQLAGTLALVDALRARGARSIAIFTGYSLEEIEALEGGAALFAAADLVVAGRYDPRLAGAAGLLSSTNQRLHFVTATHGPHDTDLAGGAVEISIRPDGSVHVTGFPPASMRRAVRQLGE